VFLDIVNFLLLLLRIALFVLREVIQDAFQYAIRRDVCEHTLEDVEDALAARELVRVRDVRRVVRDSAARDCLDVKLIDEILRDLPRGTCKEVKNTIILPRGRDTNT